MAERKKLIVFCNNYLGGVANFYRNILSNDIDNALDKKIIFLQNESQSEFSLLTSHFDIGEEIVYEVKKNKNAYQVSKELSAIIGNEESVIVTNFFEELTALHFFRRPERPVIHICHDRIYLDYAIMFEFLIDRFIAHNYFFYEELKRRLPGREKDVYYLPYGIELSAYEKIGHNNGPLRIVWLARMHKEKGIYEVPAIDNLLKERKIDVQWTIIGDGPEKDTFRTIVENRQNFSHHSPPDHKSVQELLKQQDIFILPSSLDGLPLAMLETMSMGIVPVLFEFNPGIKEVVNDEIGFVVSHGDSVAMADAIMRLDANRELMYKMSTLARQKVEQHYDIKKQAQKYFDLFASAKPSELKSKWQPLWKLHGKEYHPLLSRRTIDIYMKIKNGLKHIYSQVNRKFKV